MGFMRKQAFIIICGPSGVGKSTLIKVILKSMPGTISTISYTTRPKRPQEVNQKDYFFITKEEFTKKQKQGDFVEWAHIYGYDYATGKDQIQSCWAKGKAIIKDVDIQGLKSIKRVYPQSLAVGIFASSREDIKNRIEKRNVDFGKDLEMRVQAQVREIKELNHHVDVQIINDCLEKACQDLKKEIEQYLYKI